LAINKIILCLQKTVEKIVDLYEVGKLNPKLNQIVKDMDGELDIRSKKLRHILDKAQNEKVTQRYTRKLKNIGKCNREANAIKNPLGPML
jgi:hypothetical protein